MHIDQPNPNVGDEPHETEPPRFPRPVMPLRNYDEERRKAEEEKRLEGEKAAEESAARIVRHNALILESLVTKAFQERIRQVRGEAQPEIGPRDVHIKALIMRTLMSIEPDNSSFALDEFERL
jgi:hypothetical protein